MQKARMVEQKTQHKALLTVTRAVWGSQSGGRGLNRLLYVWTESVANVWPDFGGFLLGWRGLPVHFINITIYINPWARGVRILLEFIVLFYTFTIIFTIYNQLSALTTPI